MNHFVKLEHFEGPLDLLIHLIRKNEVDIYNVPIATITDQYLEALKLMKGLNIAIAGEFIYMAATLIYIKSRTLLPPDELPPDEENEDPRRPLVEKLLEFHMFSKAGQYFLERADQSSAMIPVTLAVDTGERGFQKLTLYNMTETFMTLAKQLKAKFHEVETENYSVSEKIEEIKTLLMPGKRIAFGSLFNKMKRMEGIVTFLAILELVRSQTLHIFQQDLLGLLEVMSLDPRQQ
ncbi:MAG: segregation/condensation protein A [Deltaproteobacteria bacterium]|nr:segregation/condensation protein A [Deltaproteobacteria bacterium]